MHPTPAKVIAPIAHPLKKTNKYTPSISITGRKWYYLGKRKTLLDFPGEAVVVREKVVSKCGKSAVIFPHSLFLLRLQTNPFILGTRAYMCDSKPASVLLATFENLRYSTCLKLQQANKSITSKHIYFNRKRTMDYTRKYREDTYIENWTNYNNTLIVYQNVPIIDEDDLTTSKLISNARKSKYLTNPNSK